METAKNNLKSNNEKKTANAYSFFTARKVELASEYISGIRGTA